MDEKDLMDQLWSGIGKCSMKFIFKSCFPGKNWIYAFISDTERYFLFALEFDTKLHGSKLVIMKIWMISWVLICFWFFFQIVFFLFSSKAMSLCPSLKFSFSGSVGLTGFLFLFLFSSKCSLLWFFKTCLRNDVHSSNVQASKVLNWHRFTFCVLGRRVVSIAALLVADSITAVVGVSVVVSGSFPNLLSSWSCRILFNVFSIKLGIGL